MKANFQITTDATHDGKYNLYNWLAVQRSGGMPNGACANEVLMDAASEYSDLDVASNRWLYSCAAVGSEKDANIAHVWDKITQMNEAFAANCAICGKCSKVK